MASGRKGYDNGELNVRSGDPHNREPGEDMSNISIEYGAGGRDIAINDRDAASIHAGLSSTVEDGPMQAGIHDELGLA